MLVGFIIDYIVRNAPHGVLGGFTVVEADSQGFSKRNSR